MLKITKQEKQRLFAIADRLLDCRPLAEQAVRRALSVYRRVPEVQLLSAPLARTLLTASAAFAYAAFYRNLTPQKAAALLGVPLPLFAPPEDIASFLLCAPEGLSFEEAAQLLELPPDEIEKRYHDACRSLGVSGRKLAETAERLREEAGVFAPSSPVQKSGASGKHLLRLAAAGFALLDITALLTAWGVFSWSRGFLTKPEPLPVKAAAEPLIPQNTGASLDALFYTVSPPGFYRVSHYRTDLAARSEYADGSGRRVTFTQQISREPVVGFSPDENYETVSFRNHPAALQFADGQWRVFWFNEYYCYSLAADLSREETLVLAESAALGEDVTLQQIPLGSLPFLYTQRLAMENNDVLIDDTGSMNTHLIEDFVENHRQRGRDAIRISKFSADGSVTVIDLQTDNGLLYCTQDTRRNITGGRETGASYSGVSVTQPDGHCVLLLESESGDFSLAYPMAPAS